MKRSSGEFVKEIKNITNFLLSIDAAINKQITLLIDLKSEGFLKYVQEKNLQKLSPEVFNKKFVTNSINLMIIRILIKYIKSTSNPIYQKLFNLILEQQNYLFKESKNLQIKYLEHIIFSIELNKKFPFIIFNDLTKEEINYFKNIIYNHLSIYSKTIKLALNYALNYSESNLTYHEQVSKTLQKIRDKKKHYIKNEYRYIILAESKNKNIEDEKISNDKTLVTSITQQLFSTSIN